MKHLRSKGLGLRLLDLGASDPDGPGRRTIQIANAAAGIGLAASVFYVALFAALGRWTMLLATPLLAPAFFGVLVLHSRGRWDAARRLMLGAVLLILALNTYLVGAGANLHAYAMPIAVLAWLLCPPGRILEPVLWSTLSAVVLLGGDRCPGLPGWADPDGLGRLSDVSLLGAVIAVSLLMAAVRAITADWEVKLRALASTDGLTGLPNRRSFEERLASELSAIRRSGAPASLALFDIDHFKRVNDVHGHAVGDDVLVEVSRIASEVLREGDMLSRIGGEEFVALLRDCDLPTAKRVAERLRDAIDSAPFPTAPGTPVTISVGVAALDAEHEDWRPALRDADTAMYAAKEAGRNQVSITSGRMEALIREALADTTAD